MRRDDAGDDEEQDPNNEYITVHKDIMDSIEQEIEFERNFYEAVCDTEDFELVMIPDEKGYIPSKEERLYIESAARKQGIKLLYRISHGKFATVFDPQTGRVGVMPETNGRGFAC